MTHKDQFIQSFFYLVEPYPYVLLKSTGKAEESAELHLLLDENRTEKIIPIIITNTQVENFNLLKHNNSCQAILYFRDASFLQINFVFDFYFKGILYLNREEVKKAAVVDSSGRRVCRLPHLAEHLFLFYLLRSIPIPKNDLRYLKGLALFEQREMERYIRKKFHLMVFRLEDMSKPDAALRAKIMGCLQGQTENRFLLRIQRQVEYHWNQWTQWSPGGEMATEHKA